MPYQQDQIRDVNAINLDPKVIWIWSINSILPSVFLLIFVVSLSFAFGESFFGVEISEVVLWTFIFLLIINIIYIIWLHYEYKNFVYYFTHSSVVIRKGVISTERHVIPYERIQDIRVSRSIIERLLNLASLKIETAAHGSYVAKYIIPSISNYHSVVNYLMEKTKEVSAKGQKERGFEESKVISLLESLIKEVKELKTVMSKKEDTSKDDKGN